MNDRPASRRLPRPIRMLAALVLLAGLAILPSAALGAAPPGTDAPVPTDTLTGAGPVGNEPDPDPFGDAESTTTLAATPPEPTIADDQQPVPPDAEPADTAPDEADPDDTTGATSPSAVARRSAPPSVRDSGIPVGSILLAAVVFVVGGAGVVIFARRRSHAAAGRSTEGGAGALRSSSEASDARGSVGHPGVRPTEADVADTSADTTTLNFLLEMGHALIDAGDAVNHVEYTIRNVAEVNGVGNVDVLVLPSALILSLQRGDTITTEVRTSRTAALRLDQIDDVFRLVGEAERGAIDPAAGRRELVRIRNAERPESPALLVVAYLVSTVGLTLLLRGGWLEIGLAVALGALIGVLTLAVGSLAQSYQAFWPLAAATIVSAAAFASARVFDDLTIFPILVSPLIVFLPGGLLTTGVLELSTGEPVSGASRLASGAMRLVLLALGILAGANLVGVPGGDIRSGGAGVVSAIAPWVGVGLFGAGIAWFNGARRRSQGWILLILYLAYSAQVLGGLLFGSTLSAFFGALAMTPAALLASRQPSGPTPLVTFLPGFWLLVPGALGLEGVTLILGDGSEHGAEVVATALISMIGISLGILLGMAVSGADATRPWSAGGQRTRRGERVGV